MDPRPHRVEPIVSAPFDQVAYVYWEEGRTEAVVVDPGFELEGIEAVLRQHGLTPVALLTTHGHADHIAGNREFKARHPGATLVIGANEAALLTDPEANLSAAFGIALTSPPADRLVTDGERFEVGPYAFLVREIPGHSPGSVVYVADRHDPPIAFVGDVVFAGSVGRTDFPGGSAATLVHGIRHKLFTLPGGTLLFPGHGGPTTVAIERATNPYVGDGVSGLLEP
jgi:glyoxylase-like metal-dependent hydrolase (beta-lactamase superfamily II)